MTEYEKRTNLLISDLKVNLNDEKKKKFLNYLNYHCLHKTKTLKNICTLTLAILFCVHFMIPAKAYEIIDNNEIHLEHWWYNLGYVPSINELEKIYLSGNQFNNNSDNTRISMSGNYHSGYWNGSYELNPSINNVGIDLDFSNCTKQGNSYKDYSDFYIISYLNTPSGNQYWNWIWSGVPHNVETIVDKPYGNTNMYTYIYTGTGISHFYITNRVHDFIPLYCGYYSNCPNDILMRIGFNDFLHPIDVEVNNLSDGVESGTYNALNKGIETTENNNTNNDLKNSYNQFKDLEGEQFKDYNKNINKINIDTNTNINKKYFLEAANYYKNLFDTLNITPIEYVIRWSLFIGFTLMLLGRFR